MQKLTSKNSKKVSSLKKRKEIWIHRSSAGTNSLTITPFWNDVPGSNKMNFSKKEANAIFDVVKNAVQSLYPNAEVNPWIDDEHGTLD